MLRNAAPPLYDRDHIDNYGAEPMDWELLVKTQPALAPLPAVLRTVAHQRKTSRGEILFRAGDRPGSVYYVLAGELQLLRHARNGQQIILQRSTSGFIAEASIDAPAYHCDAMTPVAAALLCFPMESFKAVLANDQTFHRTWCAHLAREVRKLRAQCERLSLRTAAERIIHYLEAEGVGGSLALSQTRRAWATELGVTHEALYRTLRRMQADGTLAIDGKRITML